MKKILQVSGPYAFYLPSLEKSGPERVFYTVCVVYKDGKEKINPSRRTAIK